jgi:hypothetical protein
MSYLLILEIGLSYFCLFPPEHFLARPPQTIRAAAAVPNSDLTAKGAFP